MSAPSSESLQARYVADPDFRARLDAAESAEAAIRVAAEYGTVASPGDIAGLVAGQIELSEDLLNEVSGGALTLGGNMTFA